MTNRALIKHEGDTWKVMSVGARKDGMVFLHLASTTQSRQQRNGAYPIQICDWLPESVLNEIA